MDTDNFVRIISLIEFCLGIFFLIFVFSLISYYFEKKQLVKENVIKFFLAALFGIVFSGIFILLGMQLYGLGIFPYYFKFNCLPGYEAYIAFFAPIGTAIGIFLGFAFYNFKKKRKNYYSYILLGTGTGLLITLFFDYFCINTMSILIPISIFIADIYYLKKNKMY